MAARALLIELAPGQVLPGLIAPYEMMDVIDAAPVQALPLTPPWARHVFTWQDEPLPVIDLRVRLGIEGASATAATTSAATSVLIAAFQSAPGAPLGYGALFVSGAPRSISVDDADACALPDARWHAVARTCVSVAGRAVPVLDIRRLFADWFWPKT